MSVLLHYTAQGQHLHRG